VSTGYGGSTPGLATTAALHAALVDSTDDAVITKGLDGRILTWNRGAERLYGYTEAEARGRPITLIMPAEHADDVWLILRRIADGQRVERYTTVRRRKDGTLVNVSLTVSPVHDADGAVVAASVIARDVSAQISAERRAITAETDERARLAEALHDDTIQAMTATLLLLDSALETGDAAPLRRARATLAGSLDRVRNLMFELRPRILDEYGLRAALEELAGEARQTAGFEVEVTAPDARYPRPVEELAYRTIREALLNAVRHSGASVVRIAVEQDAGRLAASVADDGCGFDPAAVSQAPGASRHAGLASVTDRVRSAGGRVWVDSSPGAGTTVRVSIVL
jgi:PAS domain S-box-containing protein